MCALFFAGAKLKRKNLPAKAVALPLVVLYSLCLVGVTLLPLPDKTTFVCGSSYYYPRLFLGWSAQFALQHNDSLLTAFFSKYTAQVLLNIALFIPFGMFLNWLLKVRLRTAVLVGFGLTLLIELTQLTGLWGYYGCAYRTFDAEDLLGNTVGAVVGWVIIEWMRRRYYGVRGLPNL